MSGTQQLVLLTLLIIQPVSSDQTDFIRDLNFKTSLFSITERCAGSAQVTGTTS